MGLNAVTNRAKLRKLGAMVGKPVIVAFSRWFENQNDLLAFTAQDEAWLIKKDGGVELYRESRVELSPRGGIREYPSSVVRHASPLVDGWS